MGVKLIDCIRMLPHQPLCVAPAQPYMYLHDLSKSGFNELVYKLPLKDSYLQNMSDGRDSAGDPFIEINLMGVWLPRFCDPRDS